MLLYLTAAPFFIGAYMAALKLNRVESAFAFVQLMILAFLTSTLAQSWQIPTDALISACAVGLGAALGHLNAYLNQREHAHQSRHYELLLRNKELEEARLQIVGFDEAERRLLAADLHDQVLNDIRLLSNDVNAFLRTPGEDIGFSIKSRLQKLQTEIREVMDQLCPSTLAHLGLFAACEDYLLMSADKASFKTRFRTEGDPTILHNLSVVEQTLLYRIVQESINNICKHANASLVRMEMIIDENQLLIRIADDGTGIRSGVKPQRGSSRGLLYMRQRADLIGASLILSTPPSVRGTVVDVSLDLSWRRSN